MKTKADLAVWVAWAKRQAEMHLHFVHPRIQVLDASVAPGGAVAPMQRAATRRQMTRGLTRQLTRGLSRRLRAPGATPDAEDEFRLKFVPSPLPLGCSPEDLSRACGVGVRLYFDVIRLFLGLALVGTLCAIPSYLASVQNVERGAFAPDSPLHALLRFPYTALLSLGTRSREHDGSVSGCVTPACERLNTLAAGLELLFIAMAFFSVRAFCAYARTIAALDQEENVRVEDYSIELFGLRGLVDASPAQLRDHVEYALQQYAEAKRQTYRQQYNLAHSPLRRGVYAALAAKWDDFLRLRCHRVADVTLIV